MRQAGTCDFLDDAVTDAPHEPCRGVRTWQQGALPLCVLLGLRSSAISGRSMRSRPTGVAWLQQSTGRQRTC